MWVAEISSPNESLTSAPFKQMYETFKPLLLIGSNASEKLLPVAMTTSIPLIVLLK